MERQIILISVVTFDGASYSICMERLTPGAVAAHDGMPAAQVEDSAWTQNLSLAQAKQVASSLGYTGPLPAGQGHVSWRLGLLSGDEAGCVMHVQSAGGARTRYIQMDGKPRTPAWQDCPDCGRLMGREHVCIAPLGKKAEGV